MTHHDHKRILIVGGGIAGVALAAFLRKTKHEVALIEKSDRWRTIGYAVNLWKNGVEILRHLDLDQPFWNKLHNVQQGAIFGQKGKLLISQNFSELSEGVVAAVVTREELHRALRSQLGTVDVRFATTLKSLKQNENSALVTFSDGTTREFDLVVGADGGRSSVRTMVFGPQYMKSYGWVIWYGYLDHSLERFDGFYSVSEPGEFLLNFPLPDVDTIGLVVRGRRDEFAKCSATDLGRLFQRVYPDHNENAVRFSPDRFFFDELVRVDMDIWHKGRVVLIGDARHARSPVSGMGTSLALEDAWVLAQELSKSYRSSQELLIAYVRRRNRRLKQVMRFVDTIEYSTMATSKLYANVRDRLVPFLPRKLLINYFKRAIEEKP